MNILTHDQIAELVVQAQEGDQEAFAALYAATADRQLYFATAFLKDASLAEDVVQDVYLRIFNAIQRIENPKTFVAYLNRATYNACVDYKKKHFPQKHELYTEQLDRKQDDDVAVQPANSFERTESNGQLYQALEELPEDQRTAFLLRYYDDMKIREVADLMNISESSVKRYVRAAQNTLKQTLAHTVTERG